MTLFRPGRHPRKPVHPHDAAERLRSGDARRRADDTYDPSIRAWRLRLLDAHGWTTIDLPPCRYEEAVLEREARRKGGRYDSLWLEQVT